MKKLILSLVAASLTGCSVSPAPLLTIPRGHPGNPESAEVPYTPPPNPFKQEVPSATPPGLREDHSHPDPGETKAPESPQPYPLEVCVVTGEKLGDMGKPVVIQHEGREVRFCCPACIDKFKQDPAKYLQKLDEAKKKQKPVDDKSKKHENHEGHP